MINPIPKIISGILVMILIAFVLYVSIPRVWFWIGFEVIAALFVSIGCAGEWWLHHHPVGRKKVDREEHHKLESRFIAAVAIGVFMEFFSLGHAIPEAVRLENDVAEANKEVATLQSQTEELRQKNDEIELKLRRKISVEQKRAFIQELKDWWKYPIRICVGKSDSETDTFVSQLRDLLDSAGYGFTNKSGITHLPPDFSYISPIGDIGGDLPLVFVYYGDKTKGVIWDGFSMTITNGSTFFSVYPNTPNSIPAFIDRAFQHIKIKPATLITTNFPTVEKAGDWVIYVPEKF